MITSASSATLPVPRAARTWRDINQSVDARVMSAEGRRRSFLRSARAALFVGAVVAVTWGSFTLTSIWQNEPQKIAAAVKSGPVRDVVLLTDGVLTQAWLEEKLALPKSASLMELDLYELRERLLRAGQVSSAVLTRRFPDTLVVTLQERTPVARVAVAAPSGRRSGAMLAARDGVVYEGVGYDVLLVNSLPWIDGIRLVRRGEGFVPVAGMDAAADLLQAAQSHAPHLYRGWQVVSLARIQDHGEIVVRARDLPEAIFSRRGDFVRQLAELDYILDFTRTHAEALPARVDLSLGSQVAVTMDKLLRQPGASTATSPFSAPSKANPQRKFSP